MGKSYNYKIMLYKFQILVRNSLDPDSGVFWIRFRIEIFGLDLDAGSMNMDPKHWLYEQYYLCYLCTVYM